MTDTELLDMIADIGLARFIGRINSGLIPASSGYEAVEHFLSHQKERSFLSQLTQALAGRRDSYQRD